MKLTGKTSVDGADLWENYGVFVEQYGYKALVQMPAFKTISVTEWAEHDGEEADLTSPVLDAKTFAISFCISGVRRAEDLYAKLCESTYHTFKFAELGGKEYKLRMTTTGSFSSLINLGKLSLSFSDDFPPTPQGTPYAADAAPISQQGYKIDDADFARYGVFITSGTDDSLRKAADIREALKLSPTTAAGVTYDDGMSPTFKAKDVTLKLLIHAPNITEFWKRYDALFATLTAAETRRLYFPKLDAEYECYYKSCAVQKFEIVPAGRVWCAFNLVFRCTAPHISTTYYLLVSEDEEFITTEDDEKAIMI